MNKEDLHDIQEKISEKESLKNAICDLAENLGTFKKSLLSQGFSETESIMLVNSYMVIALGSAFK